MNSQDMFNGISDIRDYLIEEAKNPPMKRRRIIRRSWLGAIAAALVLVMLWGIFRKPDSVPTPFDSAFAPYAIAKAEYPKMAEDMDEDMVSTVWYDNVKAQLRELGDTSSLQSFFKRSAKNILSGDDGENLIYSPLNFYMLLSSLAQITDGKSREQVLELLGSESVEELREQVNHVWKSCSRNDGAATCVLANSLWLDDDVKPKQETMDILAKDFYASSYQGEMGSKQLNEELQNWLNEQTGGLLEEQAGDINLNADCKLAFASTLYFKAKWYFPEEDTAVQTFHTPNGDIETEFMRSEDAEQFYWGKKFTAVNRMFYMGGGSMWFILPDEKYTPKDLLSDKEALDFMFTADKEDWENQEYRFVNKVIPKFDVSSKLELEDNLKKMGVKDVFKPGRADFSSMLNDANNSLFLGDIEQANRVIIDEKGCEAASFGDYLIFEAGPGKSEIVQFVLDRPFIFCITGMNGLPLFVGIVNCPIGE